MILTLNYGDLQNIKEQIISKKETNKDEIYQYIKSYKDTLNNMYKKNLVKGMSREDYEIELMDFAKSMISFTNISKSELEKTLNGMPLVLNNNSIKLWLN